MSFHWNMLCILFSSFGYSLASQSRSLLFGEESLGGCAVRLTKAQFATECTQPNQLRALMNTTVLGTNRIGI